MATDVERLVVSLEARVNQFEKAMSRARQKTDREFTAIERRGRQMESRLAGLGSNLRSFGGGLLGGFAGGVLAGGLSQIPAAIQGVVRSVADLSAEAKKAGVSAEVFQELRFAAEQSKVGIDALTDGVKELQIRADEFAITGKGPAAEAFARLGLSPEEVKARLKDPADLLNEIVNRVQRLDQAAQIRIFDEIFGGTGGEQFVRFVDQGVDGIDRLRREARDAGLVIEDELVQRAAEVDRQFNIAAQTIETRFKQAVLGAIPVVEQIATTMQNNDRLLNDFLSNPNLKNFNRMMFGNNLAGTPIPPLDPAEAARERNRALALGGLGGSATLPEIVVKPPPGSGGGSRRADEMRSERDAAEELIKALEEEIRLVGASETEMAISNNLRQAGAEATAKQQERIHALTTELVANEQAARAAAEAADFFGDAAFDSISSLIVHGEDASDVLKRLVQNLADAALQAALLGKGPLAGAFGTSGGGGLFGSLFGGLFGGGFADGGFTGQASFQTVERLI